jgi:hypothetical protein
MFSAYVNNALVSRFHILDLVGTFPLTSMVACARFDKSIRTTEQDPLANELAYKLVDSRKSDMINNCRHSALITRTSQTVCSQSESHSRTIQHRHHEGAHVPSPCPKALDSLLSHIGRLEGHDSCTSLQPRYMDEKVEWPCLGIHLVSCPSQGCSSRLTSQN